jgi:hypothetical protein
MGHPQDVMVIVKSAEGNILGSRLNPIGPRFSEAITMAYLRYHKVDTCITRTCNPNEFTILECACRC